MRISLSFLAAMFIAAIPARSAFVNLGGQVIKPGGGFAGVSTTTVPPAPLYDVSFSGTGTPSGSFVYICGTNSFAAVGDMFGLVSTPSAPVTLVNITGRIPHTICAKTLSNFSGGVQLTATSQGTLTVTALVKFSIDKKGYVHIGVSRLSLAARDSSNKKVPIAGTYIIGGGAGFNVVPSAPVSSNSATPTIIYPLGVFEWDEAILRMARNTSKTVFFILKNDGPNADNFTLIGQHPLPFLTSSSTLPPKPYFSATVYDGTNNITSAVYTTSTNGFETTGTGYSMPNFPSGGTKLIKAIVKTGPQAPVTTANSFTSATSSPGYLNFILKSATAGSTNGSGFINVNVR
jgi:hypothetical protein